MKRLLALLMLCAVPAFAQDVLEKPVSASSTSATISVTFTLGTTGYLEALQLETSGSAIQTGTVSVVNSTLGYTNTVGAWVFTNQSLNSLSRSYPMQQGDTVVVVFTYSATNATSKVHTWFKNVRR